ncbi:TetR/AcrR family transcriptional regulator [Nonomuraea sp. NPDC003214]
MNQKPLRADASQNRARILQAADAVFAAKGPSAPTEEIAKRAGVAIGTVFRHFPTKEALVEAVFVDRLRGLAARAGELATADDPGAAFFAFFAEWAELSAAKHTFADALANDGVDVAAAARQGDYPRVREELLKAVGTLLVRAQEAGAVRRDIAVPELNALLIGAARAAEHTRHDPAVHARTLAVVLDGLRAA